MDKLIKNNTYRLTVEGYASDGSGIARADGFVVFVPFAVRGDECDIKIVKVLKNHAYGIIEEVVSPSKERIQPECPVFKKCGGCDFLHMTYEEELEYKRQRIEDCLYRLGGFDPLFDGVEPSLDVLFCRNKAQFPVEKRGEKVVSGFYRRRSHQVIPTRTCLINKPNASKLANAVTDWAQKYGISVYDEESGKGLLRRVYTRHGSLGDHLCIVATSGDIPYADELVAAVREVCPDLQGVVVNVNDKKTNLVLGETCRTIWGSPAMHDDLLGNRFILSPLSFYQVNRDQAEKLYRKIAELCQLTPERDALDLCCGVGTITLTLAPHCRKVIGAEIVRRAIDDAGFNAKMNKVENAEFICADAGDAALQLKEKGFAPYAVVLDPPRKGLDERSLDAVVSMDPERIVYVACDPASLARDCRYLQEKGYKMTYAKGYDMFPRTANVETVACLTKSEQAT
ncbi:MAG: 23S rRNA (uracil(1939)-C(5))-methyltransferase RlmD [Clostridia bacterium]|nr:23S rRNA (uracil(1939)-C(5))-methyltransferase RlmD [Clostridia bacterium]